MYENFIDGFMGRKELDYLYNKALGLSYNSVIVEIGSWKGRSAQAFVEGVKDKKGVKIYCIDSWDDAYKTNVGKNVYEHFLENWKNWIKDFKVDVEIIRGSSTEVADWFDTPIDLLWIDGNHTYPVAIKDLIDWYPKVKIGGLICGHDFRKNVCEGVMKAVIEFFGKKNFKCIKGTSIWERIK